VIIALFFMFNTETIENTNLGTDPGPKLFPRILYIGLLVCGIGIISTAKSKIEGKILLNKKVLIMTLIIFLYVISLQYFGYFISTLWFVFCSFWFLSNFNKRSWLPAIVTSLVTSFIIYYVFNQIFGILLPKGVFTIF